MEQDCIFCKIASGVIPSEKVFENEDMIIIKDISPQAKLHYLLIPKLHYSDISNFALLNSECLSRCLLTLAVLADTLGLENGYRLVTNKGENGRQSVKHIHIHILGGEKLNDRMG